MELAALIKLKTQFANFTAILDSLTSISDEMGVVAVSPDDADILGGLAFAARRKLLDIKTMMDSYPEAMHLAAELTMK